MPNTIALFVTCLVDQVLPQIGTATVKLLWAQGFDVVFPPGQTCCGQPFFNSGFTPEARRLAEQTITVLEGYQTIVLPSGSCTAMLRKEYLHIFAEDPAWLPRAKALAAKTYELSEFLAEHGNFSPAQSERLITYHDSCHMSRGLGLKEQPRAVLNAAGCTIKELEEQERCCGFGGLFSIRLPETAGAIGIEKLAQASATGTKLLVTADPGCLMHLRSQLPQNAQIAIKHIAEVLAEQTL